MVIEPKVVFGLVLYNQAAYLREAIESLLAQTNGDFRIVAVDDGSDEATPALMTEYQRVDSRISYTRNARRLGMVRNWRKAFELAHEMWPDAPYFAWASDHDVWHPHWVAAMVRALDQHESAVLAYPRIERISETGDVIRRPWRFETAGVKDPWARLRSVSWKMAAGDMVYGLFRTRTLEDAGIFDEVLLPDRLLIAKASVAGEFKQVPEVLWYRRFRKPVSDARQRASFFPVGTPMHAYLPWWLEHDFILARELVLAPSPLLSNDRWLGLRVTSQYARLSIAVELTRRYERLSRSFEKRAAPRIRRARKRLMKRYRKTTNSLLALVAPLGRAARNVSRLVGARPGTPF